MGKITFELPIDDFERAMSFYNEVFGWNSEKLPFDSAVIDTDGNKVDPNNSAGVFSKRSEFVKSPVLIITVDSIDQAMEKVTQAGGSLLNKKEKVDEFGYSIYAKDTEENVFCLWEEIHK